MFLFIGAADLAPARAAGQLAPVTTGISADNRVATRQAHAVLGKLPLHFEINGGQAPAGVDFVARGHGYAAFLTREGPVLTVAHAVALPTAPGADRQPPKMQRAAVAVALELIGSNPAATATGIEPLSGVVNYYIGHQQMTGNRTYSKVRYQDIYPGIDLVYYGNQRQLEYDFVVHPGADPSVIRLGIQGADSARVDDAGDLVLTMGDREMRQHRPLVYQDGDAGRQEVAGRYVLDGGETRFELGAYDTSRTLMIDPTLSYATFLGGDGEDNAWGIAEDPAGNIYVSGVSNSLTQNSATGHSPVVPYPLKNAYQAVCCHGEDTGPAVVTKLDPTGKTLIYSTYFGGVAGTDGKAGPCPTPPDCGGAAYYARGWDVSYGITADSKGNAYVTGQAESLFFPTTADALRKSHPGPSYAQFKATGFYRDHPRDAYLAKFGPTGTLLYSTLIGGHGSDSGNSVAVIETGSAQGIYVAGIAQSVDFFGPGIGGATPMPAVNTYQRELNVAPCTNRPGGPNLTGCSKAPAPPASCHDKATGANNWACWRDGFVMRFDYASPAKVLLSTLLGSGGDDGIYGISADTVGNMYVSGETEATDFPITANAYQQCHNSNGGYPSDPTLQTPGMAPFACHLSPTPSTADFPTQSKKPYNDAHVTKIALNGALLYSTYLGGTQDDASGAPSGNFTGGQGKAITIDTAGIAYVTGFTESSTPASAAAHCGPADPNTGQGTKPCPAQVPFPTTPTAYQKDLKTDPSVPATKRASHSNTWLAKIDTTKSGVASLLYSTYLGGIGDEEAFAVATDNKGGGYVVGNTDSWDFPLRKPLPGQQFINGNSSTTTKTPQFADAFVYKIDTTKAGDASLVYSTFLGGSADEEARGIVYVNRPPGFTGVYVTGFTASDGRPHPDAPGYPGSHSCDPTTGAPRQDGDPATGLCPGQIVAFKTTPDAFQKTIAVSRKKECTNLNVPDCNTPLPADPNEDTFIVKIADAP